MDADTKTSLPGFFSAGEVSGGIHGDNRLMGNSLQDVLTFGRRAGKAAAEYVKGGITIKRLSLDHVIKFEEELKKAGIEHPEIAPMLLPDYTTEVVKDKQWTVCYQGTLR